MNFYTNITLAILAAGVVAFIMFKLQKRKEKDADDQFELTMKSRGLSMDVPPEPKHQMMHAEVAAMELPDDIEVRDENFDLSLIGKVQKKKKKTSKKVVKKKKATKRK